MDYHFSFKKENDSFLEYGVMLGSDTVIYIKTGKDANIYEGENQENKYVELADRINKEFGFTVIVASNPLQYDPVAPLKEDIGALKYHLKGLLNDCKIIFIGYSSGANYGAWYGSQLSNIQKVLLINPILNMNYHKLRKTCEDFDKKPIVIALGENDPSYKYGFMIPQRENEELIVLQGQGHHIEEDIFINTIMDFFARASDR